MTTKLHAMTALPEPRDTYEGSLPDGTPTVEIRCSSCQSSWITDRREVHLRDDSHLAAILPCPRCERAAMVSLAWSDPQARLVALTRRFFGTALLRADGNGWVGSMPPLWRVPRTAAAALSREGWFALVRDGGVGRRVHLLPAPASKRDERRVLWNVVLFFATVASVLGTGWLDALSLVSQGLLPESGIWPTAIGFAASVLFIILAHELGHFLVARRHDIRVTWPYLIPFPFMLVGTMGAVIQQRSPAPDRDAMLKMAAAGPLAGLAASIVVLALGIPVCWLVPAPPPSQAGMIMGEPLLFVWISHLLGVVALPGQEVLIHPVAMAGWFGLLLTALNLLPGGQLDGGHIARAYLSQKTHRHVTFVLSALMVPLGTLYVGWYLWAGILFILGWIGDPGACDEERPPSRSALLLALLCLVAIVVCFTPNPIQAVGP